MQCNILEFQKLFTKFLCPYLYNIFRLATSYLKSLCSYKMLKLCSKCVCIWVGSNKMRGFFNIMFAADKYMLVLLLRRIFEAFNLNLSTVVGNYAVYSVFSINSIFLVGFLNSMCQHSIQPRLVIVRGFNFINHRVEYNMLMQQTRQSTLLPCLSYHSVR